MSYWCLIKRDLSSVGYCLRDPGQITFYRVPENTRSCITGHPVAWNNIRIIVFLGNLCTGDKDCTARHSICKGSGMNVETSQKKFMKFRENLKNIIYIFFLSLPSLLLQLDTRWPDKHGRGVQTTCKKWLVQCTPLFMRTLDKFFLQGIPETNGHV